jgi:hypothetical protein
MIAFMKYIILQMVLLMLTTDATIIPPTQFVVMKVGYKLWF